MDIATTLEVEDVADGIALGEQASDKQMARVGSMTLWTLPVIRVWKALCDVAERPERIVPYY